MSEPPRHYHLGRIFAGESTLRRYIRLTVGEGAGIGSLLWHELLLGLLYWIPGLPGLALRHVAYAAAFSGFRRPYISHHVTLRCPRHMELARGVVIDEYVQLIATTRRRDGIRLGEGSFVRSFASINAGPPDGFVHIGRNSAIGQGTVLYGNGGLSIGDNVLIAGQCFIVASSHSFSDSTQPIATQGYQALGIRIEDDVWIGAGAKILDGVTIGRGAIVGANAVVNRSVAAGERVGGVPARPLATGAPSR